MNRHSRCTAFKINWYGHTAHLEIRLEVDAVENSVMNISEAGLISDFFKGFLAAVFVTVTWCRDLPFEGQGRLIEPGMTTKRSGGRITRIFSIAGLQLQLKEKD